MTEKADKPKHNSQSASKTHLTTPEQIAPETIPDTGSPDLLHNSIGAFSASPPNINTILRLQSTIGNQAVQRLLNNHGQMTSPYATAINPKSRVTISRDYRDRLQRDDAPPSASDDFMGEGWTDVNKLGLVHQDDGANLRDKPQPGGESTVLQNLPQNTKVMILKHNTTTQWRAIRVMGGEYSGLFGYVAEWLVRDDMPDPEAVMYTVQPGDFLGTLVQNHPQYAGYPIQLGDDARSLVMAVYVANQNNGGVRLNPQQKEESWFESALDHFDDYRSEMRDIYQQIELVAGKRIWLPGIPFVESLKGKGIIPNRPGWKNTLIEVAKGAAGFQIGLVEGFIGSIVDLVVGIIDLVKSVIDLIIDVVTGEALQMVTEMVEYFTELVQNPEALLEFAKQMIAALISGIVDSVESFVAKWTAPNPYDAWNFRGRVVGYVLAEVVMLLLSGGVSAAKWLGKLGKLGKMLLKVVDKVEDVLDKTPGFKGRKNRRDGDSDEGSGEGGERVRVLGIAKGIAETHDAADAPVSTVLTSLSTLKAKHGWIKGFDAQPTAPGHYRIIMREVVDADYTPGDEGKDDALPKPAPPSRLVNALKGFQSRDYKFGPNSFKLEKSGMKHILERHHPKYWDGSVKAKQSFFNKNMSIDDVTEAIDAILKQNRDKLASPDAGQIYKQFQGEFNGQKYMLGVNNNRIGQFYPINE